MKKLFVCLCVVMVLVGLSCQTPPPAQEEISPHLDDALRQIYNRYQSKLDMTGARDHTVVWGDTLSGVARRYYGGLTNVGDAGRRNGFYFAIILLTSPDSHIIDPDLIYPGLKLRVIDLRRNLDNPESRQAIKDSLLDIAKIYHAKNRPVEEAGIIRLSNSL
ncbi:MAG: LysM peptidoglycan-binding domain-containing protein [Treponema sp.]|nr:LysM peptidoglycan-binding domain-containing protein [Treponema sp.]